MTLIYVISKDNVPLMPTKRAGKVRQWLKEGKAKVKRREPFTIKLLFETTSYIQDVTVGIDTGSRNLGIAAVSENGESLYLSQVQVKTDIKSKMDARRGSRRNRRARKTRYRKARFLNRKNSIKKDRYNPTIRSKSESHIREVIAVQKILPIKNIIMEGAAFDIQKIKNPEIKGKQYQDRKHPGYVNVKEYVKARDNFTCVKCKTKRKRIEVHHIVFRSQGGSDEADNLVVLCEDCHHDLHEGKFTIKGGSKKKMGLKYAQQISIIRSVLKNDFSLLEVEGAIGYKETYGYETKVTREKLGLPKEHYFDAVAIATKYIKFKSLPGVLYKKKHVTRGDYQRTKGVRSEKSIPKGKIHGFKKFDKVQYLGKEYFIKGRRTSGSAVLMDIDGQTIDFSHMPKGKKTPKMKDFIRISARKSCLIATQHITQNVA